MNTNKRQNTYDRYGTLGIPGRLARQTGILAREARRSLAAPASAPHRTSLRLSALLCGIAIAPLRISLGLRLGFCDSAH